MNGESFFDCCLFFLTPFDPNGVLLITSMRHHDNSFMICRLEDGRFDHYKWGDELWIPFFRLIFLSVKTRNIQNISSVKILGRKRVGSFLSVCARNC
ncbi:hypothetical protein MRB53_004148 [Persea americana]|uniref:Uncharacterized protein n=1 Tax=Persea americana TaxID=3435 RepID=A0ACC2N072_PERAE|nr:hypothetical protein MRB53_004148 [Persea americana]